MNPVTMGTENWNMYMAETKARLLSGEEVNNLVCPFSNLKPGHMSTKLSQLVPLSRHSPLPELQEFVKLFRPKQVVPNTLDPRLKGLDWACIDQIFSSCLHMPPHRSLSADSLRLRLDINPNDHLAVDDQHDGDVALKNLVGDGAINAAARWADQGKLLKKLSVLRGHLGDEANAIIDQLLGITVPLRRAPGHPSSDNAQLVMPDKGKGKEISSRDHGGDSEEDTDDCDSGDERGRTAHKLFAGMAGIDSDDKENTWWVSSQPSDQGQEVELNSHTLGGILSGSPQKGRGEPVGDGAWRLNRLTPVSSPVRQPQLRFSKPCPPTPSPVRHHIQRPISSVQEPLLSPTRSPAKVSKLSAGHSLASPICLLSSSPLVEIAVEEKRQARALGSNPVRGQSSRDKPFASSKPRALVFSIHPDTSSSQAPKEPTSPMRSRNLSTVSLARQSQSGKSSSRAVQNALSWDTTPTPSRKRPGREVLTASPSLRLSKRSRLESRTTKATERTTHTSPQHIPTNIAFSSTSAVAAITPDLPTDLQEQQQSSPSIPWVYSERDMIQVKRIDMSQQLATTYPHLVAPTYAQKLDKQIEMLKRKKLESLLAAVGDLAPHAAGGQAAQPPQVLTSLAHSPARLKGAQKLGITRTILSFETVEDHDGGMDWNRSRQLVDSLREDLKSGRKPKLPPLVCAQSQSQSLDTSNDF